MNQNDYKYKCNAFASPNVSSKFWPRNQKLNVRKKQVGVKQVEENVNFLVTASYVILHFTLFFNFLSISASGLAWPLGLPRAAGHVLPHQRSPARVRAVAGRLRSLAHDAGTLR